LMQTRMFIGSFLSKVVLAQARGRARAVVEILRFAQDDERGKERVISRSSA